MQHTTDTLPEAQGPGHLGLFFIRPLFSGEGDITGSSNTEKKADT